MGYQEWNLMMARESMKDRPDDVRSLMAYHYLLHELHDSTSPWRLEDRCLECEICCGVPPWQWKDFWVSSIECFPTKCMEYPFQRHQRRWGELVKPGRHYTISYLGFGWRKNRTWKQVKHLYGICSKCNQFKRVHPHATHRKMWRREPRAIENWHELHVCYDCSKKEDKELRAMDPAEAIKKLTLELKSL